MRKITEHTYGSSIYMKLETDAGNIEEINAYIRETGTTYRTTADHNQERREEIIRCFNELY